MRVLLDACVPQDFRHALAPHDVVTAGFAGLAHLSNGMLLEAMAGRFGVLVTTDARLPSQQNLLGRPVAVIVLRAGSIRLEDLLPLVPAVMAALGEIRPGQVLEVGR